MITFPTVLILGAGASVPYGFPSGADLKKVVVDIIRSNPSDDYRVLNMLGHHTADLQTFRQALVQSGRPSVDAFLEHRSDLVDLGKRLMAIALLGCETPESLFTSSANWYDRLFQAMDAPFESFADNKLSVITFNYDRSLEQYLYLALQNSYGKSHDEVIGVLERITIVHVHGKLGPLPWQADRARPYAPTRAPDDVLLAAEGIRIISELAEERAAFDPAKSLIEASERIIFLGFGFHRANFDRLRLELDGRPRQYFASAYGLTDLERGIIEEWFRPQSPHLGGPEWDCIRFLRERVPL